MKQELEPNDQLQMRHLTSCLHGRRTSDSQCSLKKAETVSGLTTQCPAASIGVQASLGPPLGPEKLWCG
jgi:hypothetical protein